MANHTGQLCIDDADGYAENKLSEWVTKPFCVLENVVV